MSKTPTKSLFWFRRDLRLSDNPSLYAAMKSSDEILGLFIIDPQIADRAGSYRRAYLAASLAALNRSMGGKLAVITGPAIAVLQDVISRYAISEIFVTEDFAPYGVSRDRAIEGAGIRLNKVGTPYAVMPGSVCKLDGSNYRVYTPFFKAWLSHGWPPPEAQLDVLNFLKPLDVDQTLPIWLPPAGVQLQEAGEAAALKRWKAFRRSALAEYNQARNFPGIPGTSRLSPHLRWGEIHPRTILQGLNQSAGHEIFRKEIAWREFYADVLHHYPHTSRDYYSPRYALMRYDKPRAQFDSWKEGKTGYPIVDAGMRQLRAEGWMHNRVRMIVASFLLKDLHIEWQHGARYFMKYLIDNDVASNSHGWQWTAGCGTDASPYYRIFNPVDQGKRFDPDATYIRTYVPELAHLSSQDIHEPWKCSDGYLNNYVERIVDHATERLESLARHAELKNRVL